MNDPEGRLLPLTGIHNFRDYGGYAVAGGGRVRRGLLWRSGQHHEATDADLQAVAALGLAAVFDLRSAGERTSHPCRRPAGFAAAVHVVADTPPPTAGMSAFTAAPHVAAANAAARRPMAERSPAETRAGLVETYRAIAFRPALITAMRQMLRVLGEGDGDGEGGGASLVNCMAGKDRTGIAVAVVQRALGVHRDDVVADYLLTGTLGDQAARIAAGYRTFGTRTGELAPDVVAAIMGVEPEYIETALDAIAAHGEERYLGETLGLDAALRERLRARLVE